MLFQHLLKRRKNTSAVSLLFWKCGIDDSCVISLVVSLHNCCIVPLVGLDKVWQCSAALIQYT